MAKYRSLIIGMGEIGSALYRVFYDKTPVFCRDINEAKDFKQIDILHICFPYSEDFAKQVKAYIEQYNPKLTIVYSTVPIGTCELVGLNVIHSPVEGKHPRLDEGFKIFPRWLGGADEVALLMASEFWYQINRTVRTIRTSRATEFMKLRSTAKYGINLVWTDYEAKVAADLHLDYEAIKDFDRDYNYLYLMMGMPQYQRYLLDPPNGEIGGHCVISNAELLYNQYPHDMLKMLKKYKKGVQK